LQQALQRCQQQQQSNPFGNMLGPEAMAKIMANPKTAAYFQDPQFVQLFNFCKQQPQMLL